MTNLYIPDFRQYRLLPLHVRSPLDPRDYAYRDAAPVDVEALMRAGALPSAVDLHTAGTASDIFDQGQEGSCTGHMEIALAINSLRIKGIAVPERFSPAFPYWWARVAEGTQTQDAGAYPRDGLQAMVDRGLCLEHLMPYVAGQFSTPPSDAANQEATTHKLARYESLAGWQWICQALGQDRRMVGVASGWYNEWYQPTNGAFIGKPAGQPVGGHAYPYCGYQYLPDPFNGNQQALHLRLHNSWGLLYGQQGHVWIRADLTDALLYERWVGYMQAEVNPTPQPSVVPETLAAGMGFGASLELQVIRANPVLVALTEPFLAFARLLRQEGADLEALIRQAETAV